MKKVLSAVLSVIILALGAASLFSCSKEETDVPEGMKKASADSAGYSFYVPEEWICDVASGATTAYYSSSDASNVSVMAFSAEYSDYTAENWWDTFKADFEGIYSDFGVISSENTVLDENAAVKYVFQGTLDGRTYKFLQVVSVKSVSFSAPQIYAVTYTSVPDNFDSHLEDVQKMLDNFKFD